MNYLVVDFSKKYLKCSLYTVSNDSIVLQEKAGVDVENNNNNIIFRKLSRIIDALHMKSYIIDFYLFIPNKLATIIQSTSMPRLEYYDDKKIMHKQIKNTINKDSERLRTVGDEKINLMLDWSIQVDAPNQDYQNILGEAIVASEVFDIVDMIKKLKIKKYAIVSPYEGLSYVPEHDGKNHLVLDYGHSCTIGAIVNNGEILQTFSLSTGSNSITYALRDHLLKSNTNIRESLIYTKHNSTASELQTNNCLASINDFCSSLHNILQAFSKKFNEPVSDYYLIGGGANLRNIEDILQTKLRLPRVEPIFNVQDGNTIPIEIRNYLHPSLCALQNYVFSNDKINYALSKAGGMLGTINKFNLVYSKAKPVLALLIALNIATMIGAGWKKYYLEQTIQSRKSVVSSAVAKADSKKAELDKLKAQMDSVLSGTNTKVKDSHNWGSLFEQLASNSAKGLYIDTIYSKDGLNYKITGYSDAKFKATEFTILLRNNVFQSARLTNLVQEDCLAGYPIYHFTVECSTRRN